MIRRLWLVGCAATLLTATAPEIDAQGPATAQDSILARLERAEEQINLLRQQLAAQAASQVQSKSRASLEFSGRVLVNGWRNSARVNNLDAPQLVLPASGAVTTTLETMGADFRQSMLALDVRGVQALGGDVSAHVSGDFNGGVQNGAGGRRLFPEPRLRIARGTVRWSAVELMAGQDVPLLAPVEPTSLASTGTPDFAQAGNLWFWLPQVRLGIETPMAGARVGLQGSIQAPWSGGDVLTNDPDAVDLGERSRRPTLEGRVRVRWGEDETGGEIGFAGHMGWIGVAAGGIRRSNAMALSAIIPIFSLVELRGEAYDGELLRGLGGGGVGQNIGSSGLTILDRGAWGQLNLKPSSMMLLGAGCGVDNPRDNDLPARRRNGACEVHMHVRPAALLVTGIEVRRMATTYTAGVERATHVNLAMGVEF